MTDVEKTPEPRPEPAKKDRPLPEAESLDEGRQRDSRQKAASSLLSPAVPPAGAAAIADVDPRLDDRSETERALERATSAPD